MSDSFIVDVPELKGAAKDMIDARNKFASSFRVIDLAFKGIEWTDDSGNSFQDQVKIFKDEVGKVSGRLMTNSTTLVKAANAAEQTQDEIKKQVVRLYQA